MNRHVSASRAQAASRLAFHSRHFASIRGSIKLLRLGVSWHGDYFSETGSKRNAERPGRAAERTAHLPPGFTFNWAISHAEYAETRSNQRCSPRLRPLRAKIRLGDPAKHVGLCIRIARRISRMASAIRLASFRRLLPPAACVMPCPLALGPGRRSEFFDPKARVRPRPMEVRRGKSGHRRAGCRTSLTASAGATRQGVATDSVTENIPLRGE